MMSFNEAFLLIFYEAGKMKLFGFPVSPQVGVLFREYPQRLMQSWNRVLVEYRHLVYRKTFSLKRFCPRCELPP